MTVDEETIRNDKIFLGGKFAVKLKLSLKKNEGWIVISQIGLVLSNTDLHNMVISWNFGRDQICNMSCVPLRLEMGKM